VGAFIGCVVASLLVSLRAAVAQQWRRCHERRLRLKVSVVAEDNAEHPCLGLVEVVHLLVLRLGLVMHRFCPTSHSDPLRMVQHGTEAYAETRTRLLTIAELADLLNVERKTVYRLGLPYVVVGARRRFRLEDVDAYLEARKVAAG
jgi:excisionase family DNA binding protein